MASLKNIASQSGEQVSFTVRIPLTVHQKRDMIAQGIVAWRQYCLVKGLPLATGSLSQIALDWVDMSSDQSAARMIEGVLYSGYLTLTHEVGCRRSDVRGAMEDLLCHLITSSNVRVAQVELDGVWFEAQNSGGQHAPWKYIC